uniref:3'-5' exonuclease domain-containing protein n=1 Tax=Trichuris muris TaxID=70415 RepID=A0A5S6QXP9_TRIMR
MSSEDEEATASNPDGDDLFADIIERMSDLKTHSSPDLLESMCACVKKCPTRSFRRLAKCLDALPDPLRNVLQLLESCPSEASQTAMDSVKCFLVAFHKWLGSSLFNETEKSADLKARALSVATEFSMNLLTVLDDIYDLKSAESLCLASIWDLINRNRHHDAAVCMLTFKLCSRFSEVEVALPLVLLHEQKLAASCVEGDINKQKRLARIVDSNLHPKGKFFRFINKYRPLEPKKPQFELVNAERFLKFVIKHFNLDVSEVAPNLEQDCLMRGVQYFIRLRYKTMELPGSCFSELMDDILMRYPSIRQFAVSELMKVQDLHEAYRLCELFRIFVAELPMSYSWYYIYQCGPLILTQDLPIVDRLRLPNHVCIRFVRNAEDFRSAVEHAKQVRLAALDSEWTPNIGFNSGGTIAALLQIAVDNSVYLVEIDELLRNSSREDISKAFENLMCTSSILKLGFDFSSQDVTALVGALPFCAHIFARISNLTCVQRLAQSKINDLFGANYPEKFSALYGSRQVNCGLKNLCKALLDVELDKRQRLSNWKRRPLRPEQVEYAALDVYCLLLIYQKLSTMTNSS